MIWKCTSRSEINQSEFAGRVNAAIDVSSVNRVCNSQQLRLTRGPTPNPMYVISYLIAVWHMINSYLCVCFELCGKLLNLWSLLLVLWKSCLRTYCILPLLSNNNICIIIFLQWCLKVVLLYWGRWGNMQTPKLWNLVSSYSQKWFIHYFENILKKH